MSDPEYIERFSRAVYPDSTALCMSMATEKSMLTDAAAVIEELRAWVEEMHSPDEVRGLKQIIERRDARVEELNETIAFLDPPYGILELQDQLDEANERVEEMEKELDYQLNNEAADRHTVRPRKV